MELLVQVAPAFFLGLRWSELRGRAVLAGMLAGLAIAIALPIAGIDRPGGVHAGLIGLATNLAICVYASTRGTKREPPTTV